MNYTNLICKTTYAKDEHSKQIIISGSVVIDGIEHYVSDGYIKCNPYLNRSSWNTTQKTSICIKCFPKKLSFKIDKETHIQLKLF